MNEKFIEIVSNANQTPSGLMKALEDIDAIRVEYNKVSAIPLPEYDKGGMMCKHEEGNEVILKPNI